MLPSFAAETLQNVKLDPLSSRTAGTAVITSTAFDIGDVDDVFDGSVSSLARTPNISPAFIQVAYTTARIARRFRVHCTFGTSYDWWVEKADTQADLDAKTGTYAKIVPNRNFAQGTWSEFTLPAPVTAKIFKLTVDRHGGDDYCHINEWELYGDVVIDQLTVEPVSLALFVNQSRQFSATGRVEDTTETIDLTSGSIWSAGGSMGTITSGGYFSATAVGSGSVQAALGSLASAPAAVTVALGNAQLDVNVLLLERTPRLAFDPANTTYTSGLPAPGQAVTYLAHVKNWGTVAVVVPFEWRFDGAPAGSGSVSIGAGQTVTVPFAWTWQAADHSLEFVADAGNTLHEAIRLNNRLVIRTNALLVGLWVEQGLYDHMHQHQYKLNDGANSFEDWGQRMVARWNDMFAKAIFPNSPNGFLDRLALDKVVVVPDDALPLNGGLATNNPDSRDRTVDMQWGYPWNPSNVEPGQFYGFRWSGPFFIDYGSIHEMNHARFHTDLYAIDANQPSTPKILLTNDSGALAAGTSLMPFIAFDIVHYNKWRDEMGAGPHIFDAYSAGVWNWKHHKRGRGNMNAPPDFEVFTNDLPANNHFKFVDQNGRPLTAAQVEVFQSSGETIDDTADFTFTADANGSITLPRNPFGGSKPGAYNRAVIVFKVRYAGQLYFLFQEFTDFNLEYWRGNTQNAYYTRPSDLRNGPVVPSNAWLGNYSNGTSFETFVSSRNDANIDFNWPAAPVAGLNADEFSVYWQREVQFSNGWKTFTITADGGVQLLIDGRLVFDQSNNSTLQTWTPDIYTTSNSPYVTPGKSAPNGNNHRMEVRYRHTSGTARVAVSWTDETPAGEIPTNHWRADYWNNEDFTGYLLSRAEERIDNDYGSGSPEAAFSSGDTWSARWIGNWDFQAKNYTFTAQAADGIRVWIDDVVVIDQWSSLATQTHTVQREMTAGPHKVEVKYHEGTGSALVKVNWALTPVNLSVIQADAPDPVSVEGDLVYTITVRNQIAAFAATGVTLTSVLPAEVVLVSAVSSQGTCTRDYGTVTCALGTLNGNAQATITITVRPQPIHNAQTLANLATVTADQPDSVIGNNTSSATTAVIFQDSDSDLVPDPWETRHGLAPGNPEDATLDLDADGFSNRAEYFAGTNPADPTSHFELSSQRTPAGVLLRLTTAPGRRYRIVWTADLAAGAWIVLEDAIEGIEGIITAVDETAPAPERRFYRGEVLLP